LTLAWSSPAPPSFIWVSQPCGQVCQKKVCDKILQAYFIIQLWYLCRPSADLTSLIITYHCIIIKCSYDSCMYYRIFNSRIFVRLNFLWSFLLEAKGSHFFQLLILKILIAIFNLYVYTLGECCDWLKLGLHVPVLRACILIIWLW